MKYSRIALTLICSGFAGCTESGVASPPNERANQYIVAIDISGSRTPRQLAESQRLVTRLIKDRLHNGDRLILAEVFGRRDGNPDRWDDTVRSAIHPGTPAPIDLRRLGDFKDDASGIVPEFFAPARAKAVASTDIIRTLYDVADIARSSNRRTTVLLLSDMMQEHEDVQMGRAVPGPDWIATRKNERRLPDLRGVCVVVSGADVASERGAQVRQFWSNYLTASGATIGDYRSMIVNPAEVQCGGGAATGA